MFTERDAAEVLVALAGLRRGVRWRSEEDPQRLRVRVQALIRLGHLPLGATLATYHAIVEAIAADPEAEVYVCQAPGGPRPTLLSRVTGTPWIVVCDLDGVVETAFPSADPGGYFAGCRSTRLGTVRTIQGGSP